MQRHEITQEGCFACGRPASVVIYYVRQVRFSVWAKLLQIWIAEKIEIWRKRGVGGCLFVLANTKNKIYFLFPCISRRVL